jgi:hypothetical protein
MVKCSGMDALNKVEESKEMEVFQRSKVGRGSLPPDLWKISRWYHLIGDRLKLAEEI